MIPRIIHYIWLGGGEIPQRLQSCIDSWKNVMPDYEYVKWDDESISVIDIPFVNEAIKEKKWAFASDVIRLWVINEYGGIYLDTDVQLYKPFDSLLNCKAFIGREKCLQVSGKNTEYHLTSYCFGAEKGNDFVSRCLDYYSGKRFIVSKDKSLPMHLRLDVRNASFIYSEIAKLFGYNSSTLAPPEQDCEGIVTVVCPEVFADSSVSDKTIARHLYVGSWRETPIKDPDYTFRYKIEWRIRKIVERILKHFGYIMVKLR